MPFVRNKRGQVLIVHNTRVDGAVRQDVIHAFPSADALAATLDGWDVWTEMMAWRHPDFTWRWPQLRARLAEELGRWQHERSGAAVHKERKLGMLAGELLDLIKALSPARPADSAVLDRARPQLTAVQAALDRVLRRPTDLEREESHMQTAIMPSEAEQLFEAGMESWWQGDPGTACRLYRRALQVDPEHADAHNHLGIWALERGRVKDAERHFEAAVQGGARRLQRERDLVEWGWPENRPNLRGLANLALVHRRRRKWQEALEIHQRILEMNPNDNQGVRFLIGDELQHLDRVDDAIAACRNALEEPGSNYSLALALHKKGRDAGAALLRAFSSNRYVPPMLLGEPWRMLDGFHSTNMAEPEWAAESVERAQDLWRKGPGSADLLRFWWHASLAKAWREELDRIVAGLDPDASPAGSERRDRLLARQAELASEETFHELARRVRALC